MLGAKRQEGETDVAVALLSTAKADTDIQTTRLYLDHPPSSSTLFNQHHFLSLYHRFLALLDPIGIVSSPSLVLVQVVNAPSQLRLASVPLTTLSPSLYPSAGTASISPPPSLLPTFAAFVATAHPEHPLVADVPASRTELLFPKYWNQNP